MAAPNGGRLLWLGRDGVDCVWVQPLGKEELMAPQDLAVRCEFDTASATDLLLGEFPSLRHLSLESILRSPWETVATGGCCSDPVIHKETVGQRHA